MKAIQQYPENIISPGKFPHNNKPSNATLTGSNGGLATENSGLVSKLELNESRYDCKQNTRNRENAFIHEMITLYTLEMISDERILTM